MSHLNVYSNVVALVPRNAPAPTLKHVRLLHLDGREFATAGFLPGLASAPWTWIAETVAAECGCDPEDVHVEEAGDEGGGDFVTALGERCFRVGIGRAPSV